MNDIKIWKLALTYAGCFLGAGYVSGQELWQFFGNFGINGILGLILTVLAQILFGIFLIKLVQKTSVVEIDKVVINKDIPILRIIVGAFTTFFMFGIYIIMTAGAGALLYRMCNMPQFLGSALFCIITTVISFKGKDGLVSVFSCIVPVLVLGTVAISVVSLCKTGFDASGFAVQKTDNILLNNWFISSLSYIGYNLFGTIGIIAPISHTFSKKSIVPGIVLGCVMLFAIAFSIILAIVSNLTVTGAELPMLELALNLNKYVGWVYAILLLFGMFGTSLSSFVAVETYAELKWKWFLNNRRVMIILLNVFACVCSLFGFGDLIGTVYPISGYFGFVVVLCVMANYFTACVKRNK